MRADNSYLDTISRPKAATGCASVMKPWINHVPSGVWTSTDHVSVDRVFYFVPILGHEGQYSSVDVGLPRHHLPVDGINKGLRRLQRGRNSTSRPRSSLRQQNHRSPGATRVAVLVGLRPTYYTGLAISTTWAIRAAAPSPTPPRSLSTRSAFSRPRAPFPSLRRTRRP
ncbi:hypothetical protein LX32DRAFT_131926 [Colletotrichum zoysiae]|uniref:Uncharacterized protein n=1 Tax=Colletotrichum zoysiae TaxID=1216348 RepID=A0AAD9LWI5_9PEZI|nr:hypothetical protein LX32DRAFT_131926 [Colletotrichum zoysiae]